MIIKYKSVRYIVFLLFLIFIFPQWGLSNVDEKTNSHVIISFDNSLDSPQFIKLLVNGSAVQQSIKKILSDNHILNDSFDYYSFVNFACGRNIDNFKRDFVVPCISDSSQLVVWVPFEDYDKMFKSHGNWDDLVYRQGKKRASKQGYGPFSLLTGAKQYSLAAVVGRNDGHYANRTYLLMVTDNWYAGMDDYQKEFNDVFGTSASQKRPNFSRYYDGVNSLYKFVEIGSEQIEDNNEYEHFSNINKKYQAILYEVLPISTFSLGSVVDYPANLGLKRVKGGYKVDFAFNTVDQNYTIEKLKLELKDNAGKSIIDILDDGNGRIYSKDVVETRLFPQDSVYVTLCGWIRQIDKVYGGLMMNPYDSHYSRLKVNYRLPLEPAATVFGQPLEDDFWWWYPDNAALAALVWEAIIVFVLLVVFVLLIRWILIWRSVYKPSDKVLKLGKIE